MSAGGPAPSRTSSDLGSGLAGAALGLIAGAFFSHGAWGALSGAGIGAALGLWRAASRRAGELRRDYLGLERRIRSLEESAIGRWKADAREGSPEAPVSPSALEPEAEPGVEPGPDAVRAPQPPETPPPPSPVGIAPPARHSAPPRSPSPVDVAAAALRDFFLGGNTVVRVGILVLLFGVTLLAKWAADHALFPIEARLAAAAAIGFALAATGFRLRERRPGFATTLQGGGVAALYLVVFFAFRTYGMLPAGLAFALFAAIALACGVLALLQRSQPLIFIGSIGGFLAPVAASTGGGQHIVLFTWYLLLDVAIAAVAWRESWRALNALAFVCTWGVATVWGVLRYRPEDFATTEPFLLAFVALFTATAILGAWRRPPHLAGFVDGTLVFGTPLVALLAQSRLVEGRQLGMAISTACFGLYYAVLATWVWRNAPPAMRRMAEAFVALALVFGTIAIPLAVDDALTTTLVWSLEGAGIYWLGARQERRLARFAGIALQGLGAVSFALASSFAGYGARAHDFAIAANPRFLSCVALAFAGGFIAREAWVRRAHLARGEAAATQGLAGWALLWWAGGILAEVDQFASGAWRAIAVLAAIAASFPALALAAERLRWTPGRLWALAAIPAGLLAIPISLDHQDHLLAQGGLVAWSAVLAAVYFAVARLEGAGVPQTRHAWAPALWLAALVAAIGIGGVAERGLGLAGDWPAAAFGLGLAAVVLCAGHAFDRRVGAFSRHPDVVPGPGLAPPAALGILWLGVANLAGRGDAAPLPYLPFANPTDLASALLVLAAADVWLRSQRVAPPALPPDWWRVLAPGFAGLLFFWGNGILARSVHQWADVPFTAAALWESTPFQASLSIAWTGVALAGMLWCTRRGWRSRWIAASTLLGVTVVKLFLVDLSTLSTGARIGTFLVVGVLLLVVGYLSPVPPAAERGSDANPDGREPAGREGGPVT